MNLFELFVKIGVDDQASKNISNIAGKLGNGLKTAAKVGTAAVATVTAAATAMTAAFIKGTSEVAQYGDNIDKMSQKMGLSAEAYQEWDFIMQHSGTSMEALKAGMKTLANAVESGNKAFERLGITQEEIAEMNQEELFARTLEGLQGVTDETERTYLAGQLLGRGATELGALLNTSEEDVEAMRQQVHDLGGVMSNEAVKAAAAYQDSLQNMQTAFAGIQRGMLSEFLPSMVTVMDGLALIFSGNDSGIAKITEGVNQFVNKLMEAVPKIFELGEGILSSLATAILDNLPTLTSTATSVIIKLVDGIVSALPVLAESAIEIIGSLTQGLSDSLPTIIESAVELISTLADGILNMLPQIVKLGLDLIVSLAMGIADALPELVPTVVGVVSQIVDTLTRPETLSNLINVALTLVMVLMENFSNPEATEKVYNAIFELVDSLVDFLLDEKNLSKLINSAVQIVISLQKGMLKQNYALVKTAVKLIGSIVEGIFTMDWAEVGKDVVSGVLSGLKTSWVELKKWFTNAWDNLVGGVKDLLGIHSPSRVFAGIGKNMALGVGEGWEDTFGDVQDDINSSMEFGEADYGITTSTTSFGDFGSGSVGANGGLSIVQNIYSEAKTAADLMREALWQQEKAVYLGV